MGIVRMGPPEELILYLQKKYAIHAFVETGTFQGGTTLWASDHFSNVVTIENSRPLFDKAVKKFEAIDNVKCLYGDSRVHLLDLVKTLSAPAVFWLDSHWCGADSYGEDDQCPLIEEIEIINSSSERHLIFIDDARLFLSPPPFPNRIEHWPPVLCVCQALDAGQFKRFAVIFEDVLIAVPENMKNDLAHWCQRVNTEAWKASGAEARQHKLKKGLRQLSLGVKLLKQAVKESMARILFSQKS